MKNLTIRLEPQQDHTAAEALIREAFWNVYKPGCDEHYYAHILRTHPGFLPEPDFILCRDGEIFGNPANYLGRGFVSCKRKNVCLAEGIYPTSLLVKELIPGCLEGRVRQFADSIAPECCSDTAAAEAFDAAFPKKERHGSPARRNFISTVIYL